MTKRKLFLWIMVGILAGGLVAGCRVNNQPPPTPEVNIEATQTENAIRTQAAETLVAALTESAEEALLTASAPATIFPDTSTPTVTATVTNTPFLSGSATPTITLTPAISPTLVLPSMSPVPVDWKCNLVRTTPKYKTVLGKGEYFEVHWILLNSGSQGWFNNNVSGAFRNGMAMHSGDGTFKLLKAVLTGETYEAIMPMTAPKEPGQYSSVWILKNKTDTFCWFSVDIVVQ